LADASAAGPITSGVGGSGSNRVIYDREDFVFELPPAAASDIFWR